MNKFIIFVIGCTGCGKTALSIELAKAFAGEVINADSMQVYKSLPIATASPSSSERGDIPHHLFNFLDLDDEPYDVFKYLDDSLRVIGEVRERGNVPIVVGGTHYYLLSLLFKGFFPFQPFRNRS